MPKKSSEVRTSIDTITNLINLSLFILGIILIPLGIFYMTLTFYDYMVRLGWMLLIGGIIAIIMGIIGIVWHTKVAKKMQAQAKADLNY